MRILVTNDDGIAAPGLAVLARAVAEAGHDVLVAAPDAERSGASAALSAVEDEGRIVVARHTVDGVVEAFAVGGSPAFIAWMALSGAFGDPPEAVVSGVNRGANAGRAVLHSGTVGAALTAAAAGLPGLAVSLDVLTAVAATAESGGAAVRAVNEADDAARNWATAARVGVDLMSALTAGVVINVNAPDVPFERLPGIRRATLARFGQVQMTVVEAGEGFVRTSVEASTETFEPGTDLAVLADGYASVTAIRGLAELSDVELPGLDRAPLRRGTRR